MQRLFRVSLFDHDIVECRSTCGRYPQRVVGYTVEMGGKGYLECTCFIDYVSVQCDYIRGGASAPPADTVWSPGRSGILFSLFLGKPEE